MERASILREHEAAGNAPIESGGLGSAGEASKAAADAMEKPFNRKDVEETEAAASDDNDDEANGGAAGTGQVQEQPGKDVEDAGVQLGGAEDAGQIQEQPWKDVEDAGIQSKDEPWKPSDLVNLDGDVMLPDGSNAPLEPREGC